MNMRCGCFSGGDGEGPPEPTEEEYNAALGEATQALEDAVVGINEALTELRYELAELDGDA